MRLHTNFAEILKTCQRVTCFQTRASVLIISSKHLQRDVTIEIIEPLIEPDWHQSIGLLVLNDGQDNVDVGVRKSLRIAMRDAHIHPILVAAVVAGDRMAEYGMARYKDYKGRGAQSAAYQKFIVYELLPLLEERFRLSSEPRYRAVAGYSLGGLSAMDIAWNHPHAFGMAGCFSGSFWWRQYTLWERLFGMHRGRLMHRQVERTSKRHEMRFWFQCGTADEIEDRNQNGVIDAIDDTLDLMVALTRKGYRPYHDFQYHEMAGGEHNPATWKLAFPVFLKWAFGK